jgi:hypothetical protein
VLLAADGISQIGCVVVDERRETVEMIEIRHSA